MDETRVREWLPAILLLTACATTPAGLAAEPTSVATASMAAESPPPAEDAAALFARVEETLLAEPDLRLKAALSAEGSLQAALEAHLALSKDRAELAIKGSFAGQAVDTKLAASGDTLQIGKGKPLTRPAALHEALVLGFTRMGLMHNSARLTGAGLPDHADGGVRNWLETKEHAFGAETAHEGKPARVITYVIYVEGTRSADGKVWIDPATLRPLARQVVVHFPQGDMHVTERYQYGA